MKSGDIGVDRMAYVVGKNELMKGKTERSIVHQGGTAKRYVNGAGPVLYSTSSLHVTHISVTSTRLKGRELYAMPELLRSSILSYI